MALPDMAKLLADNLEREFDQADRRLLKVIDTAFDEGARRAGRACACRVGCTACCIGPFPITLLDARRLRLGLGQLAHQDPDRAERIRLRGREAIDALGSDFPGDAETGLLGADEQAEESFCERHRSMPCPVLDPETGRCDLYAARPISCRTFGPPTRVGEELLAPCDLWFKSEAAVPARIEACRVEIDPDGLEADLLDDVEAAEQRTGETIVAFALTRRHNDD